VGNGWNGICEMSQTARGICGLRVFMEKGGGGEHCLYSVDSLGRKIFEHD
jgi:hypothetical protein